MQKSGIQPEVLSWSVGKNPVSKWLLLLLFITFESWVGYLDKFILLVHMK